MLDGRSGKRSDGFVEEDHESMEMEAEVVEGEEGGSDLL